MSSTDLAKRLLTAQLNDLLTKIESGEATVGYHRIALDVLKELEALNLQDSLPAQAPSLASILPFKDPEEHRDAIEA